MTDEAKEAALLKDAQDALKIAKITMMMQRDTTFYTTILFSLKQIITADIPTAATDGRKLLINPKFFTDLLINERIALLAHEILHVALDHMHRRGSRDPQIWNMAADYVINYLLAKAGYQLPEGGLYDSKYADKTTEQVYDILFDKSDQDKASMLSGYQGDVQYPEDAQSPADAVTQDEVTDIVLRASTQAKAMGSEAGNVPSEVGISLKKALSKPLPWGTILNNYMTEFAKDDYTFKRPNRRFMPDYYLPTAKSEAIANIAVCVDASSSVTDGQFNDFISKIHDIQRTMRPKKITVMSFNTQFISAQELNDGDNPFTKLKFNGRGGTRIQPVHKWLAETKPTVALIFTDGFFTQIEPEDKKVPLIWLIFNNSRWETQHGRVVHYEIDNE